MHAKFVKTSNVDRFLAAVTATEERGAREAGWVAAIGDPGLGKTRTLHWWATTRRAVFLRAKAEWSALWVLRELAEGLDLSAEGTKQQLFGRILEHLALNQIPIVIDEVEKTRHNPRLLEGVRDLSDLTEVEVVLGGTADALRYLARHPQWSSRISATAKFAQATAADVRLMCDTLCEVKVADDLAEEILKQSQGYFREVKNAIAAAERIGLANGGGTVCLADVARIELCRNRKAVELGGRR